MMSKQYFLSVINVMLAMLVLFAFYDDASVSAQTATCELVNQQEQMAVYFAPIVAPSQLRDILPQTTPYSVIGRTESFFQIEYYENEQGWVDLHTRILNGDCLDVELSQISLNDFPTVCLYTITEALIGYSDTTLTTQHPGFGIREPGTYAVVSRSNNAIELMGTSAISGGFVEANRGILTGHCDGTVQLVIALDNARLWSAPNVETGEVITTFDIGAQLGILDGPIQGLIRLDGNVVGDWYQVTQGDNVGWIWNERLLFGRTFTTPQPILGQASVTDNARLWSEPNAKTGQIISTLFMGSTVQIIGEPVDGFIQLDTDLIGTWYPVQQGGATGWVYEGRLNFANNNG